MGDIVGIDTHMEKHNISRSELENIAHSGNRNSARSEIRPSTVGDFADLWLLHTEARTKELLVVIEVFQKQPHMLMRASAPIVSRANGCAA